MDVDLAVENHCLDVSGETYCVFMLMCAPLPLDIDHIEVHPAILAFHSLTDQIICVCPMALVDGPVEIVWHHVMSHVAEANRKFIFVEDKSCRREGRGQAILVPLSMMLHREVHSMSRSPCLE